MTRLELTSHYAFAVGGNYHPKDGISKIVVTNDRGVVSRKGREGTNFVLPRFHVSKDRNSPARQSVSHIRSKRLDAMTAPVATRMAVIRSCTMLSATWPCWGGFVRDIRF